MSEDELLDQGAVLEDHEESGYPEVEDDIPSTPPDYFGAGFLCGALVVLLAVVVFGSLYYGSHHEKHTGAILVAAEYGQIFEMQRPNGEIFLMNFDYTETPLHVGEHLYDLTYRDKSETQRTFVKAAVDDSQDAIVSLGAGVTMRIPNAGKASWSVSCLSIQPDTHSIGPNWQTPSCLPSLAELKRSRR